MKPAHKGDEALRSPRSAMLSFAVGEQEAAQHLARFAAGEHAWVDVAIALMALDQEKMFGFCYALQKARERRHG